MYRADAPSPRQWAVQTTAGGVTADDRPRPDKFVHIALSHLPVSESFNLTGEILWNRNVPRIGGYREFYLCRPLKRWARRGRQCSMPPGRTAWPCFQQRAPGLWPGVRWAGRPRTGYTAGQAVDFSPNGRPALSPSRGDSWVIPPHRPAGVRGSSNSEGTCHAVAWTVGRSPDPCAPAQSGRAVDE